MRVCDDDHQDRRDTCRRSAPPSALSLVATLFVVVAVGAPALALDPTKAITQYTRTTWTDELPQNTVRAIAQTADGYLWIGTYEGLARFDGSSFEIFDRARTGDLPGTAVYDLREDMGGALWAGTNGGLVRISAAGFHTFTTADGLPSNLVHVTLRAPGGRLWVGTDHGLAAFERSSFRTVVAGDVVNEARDLAVDADGALWIASDRGLFRLVGERVTRFDRAAGLPDERCWVILRGRDDALWVGTDGGLARYAGGSFTTFGTAQGLPDPHVRALFEDRQGNLWVGTEDSGLSRLAGGRITTFGEDQGLIQNHVRAIFEDHEGSLWVGTNGGLVQLADGKFTTYTTAEGLAHDFARAILEDAAGTLWIGTDGGGLNRLRDSRFEVFTTADGLSSDSVRSLCATRDGALWVGTRGGLDRYDGRRFRSYTTADGLSGDNIRALLEDRHGTLWVGTESNGVTLLSAAGTTVLGTAQGLPSNRPRVFFEDRHGDLWIGSYGGASRSRDGAVVRTYTTADGLSNDIVFAFAEDHLGNLWIGTDGGLNLLRDDAITGFDRAAGLVDNTVFRILLDDRGTLWTSSNRGISTVPLDELYAVADGRLDRVRARGFNRSDGMKANQCNGVSQPAGWRSSDGRLWFPTVKGVVAVDPDDLHVNRLPPTVAIAKVIANGAEVSPRAPADLADGRSLELRYTALSFLAPERIRFRFRLEGFDPEWTDAGSRRSAFYTNLPPGEFRFQVVACNADGVWNEEGASWAFTIPTPLHRRWWAVTLYVVAAVLVVGTGVRARLQSLGRRNLLLEARVAERTAELAASQRELEAKNRLLAEQVHRLEMSERHALDSERQARESNRAKSVFLSNMSHELRTPLNSIIGFASILTKKLGPTADPRTARFLKNILSSGEHLLELINELLDLAKIEAGRMGFVADDVRLAEVLDGVVSVMRGVAAESDIMIDVAVAADVPPLSGDRGKVKQILFNLLSNAVKFSPRGSTVTVEASFVPAATSPLAVDAVAVAVVDRGIGIRKEDQEIIFEEFRQADGSSTRRFEGTGLGLALVRRLLEMHGGRVTVDSEPGKGSTFTVHFPVAATVHESVAVDAAAELTAAAPAAGGGRTVLVVEDDPVSFHALARELESEGYSVLGAATGEQALEMVERHPPDLISLDVILPGIGGWDVLKQLRARPDLRGIPVVIVTALENRELGTALGADDFFVKPVQRDVFIRRVRELAPLRRDGSGPPTILVVDDEVTVHDLIAAELEGDGYRLLAAASGEEGVDLALRHPPDLVILDLMMPGMSGFEVTFRLRAEAATARVPIIVLSARELSVADRQVLAGKIVTHIAKGADALPRLTATIRTLLGAGTGPTAA